MADTGQILINAEELEVLYALRELCPAFNEPGAVRPDGVEKKLAIDSGELLRRVSFLDGYGLVWIRGMNTSGFGRGMSYALASVALSTHGESYLRAIDNRPGIAQRVTLATFAGIRNVVVEAGRAALAELVAGAVRAARGG